MEKTGDRWTDKKQELTDRQNGRLTDQQGSRWMDRQGGSMDRQWLFRRE